MEASCSCLAADSGGGRGGGREHIEELISLQMVATDGVVEEIGSPGAEVLAWGRGRVVASGATDPTPKTRCWTKRKSKQRPRSWRNPSSKAKSPTEIERAERLMERLLRIFFRFSHRAALWRTSVASADRNGRPLAVAGVCRA